MGVSKTSQHIQIKIRMLKFIQKPPASSQAPNKDLKDIYILCTCKIKTGNQNLEHECIKDHWLYPNQDQDVKLQSGTSSLLQNMDVLSNFKIKRGDQNLGPGCIKDQWPYTNQDNDTKLQSGTSRLHRPPKSQIGTYRTWMFFAPSKSI